MKLKPLFVLLLMVFALSCRKNDFDFSRLKTTEWNPNIALPLVNASYGVYDILANVNNNDLVVINPNTGFIALVYRGELFSFKPSDIFSFSNQYFQYQLQLDPISSANLGLGQNITGTLNNTFEFNFTDNDVEIKEIKFKGGTLKLDFSSSFQNDVNLEVSIPNLTLNNQPFTRTVNLNSTNNVYIELVNLNGYKFNFNPINEGVFDVKYQIVGNTQNTVNGSESVTFKLGFENLEYRHAIGKFGTLQVLSDRDSLNLRIFSNVFNGDFQFTNPTVSLLTENSFGIPLELKIEELKSINLNNNLTTSVLLSNFTNPYSISSPTTMGFVTEDLRIIDKNNSNIKTVISPTPQLLYLQMGAYSNPSMGSNINNFITDESLLKIDVELSLPLEGYAYGFYILDTVVVNISQNIDEIESVLFRLNITNGFPVDLDAQLYFTDENFIIIDSLVNETVALIPSGITNQQGRVITPTNKITDIVITKEKVPNIFKAQYIIIRADANTTNSPSTPPFNVRFYDDYKLELKLGMQVQGKILF